MKKGLNKKSIVESNNDFLILGMILANVRQMIWIETIAGDKKYISYWKNEEKKILKMIKLKQKQ